MAKIVKKNHHLENEYASAKSGGKLGGLLFLAFLLFAGICLFAYLKYESVIFLAAALGMGLVGAISLHTGSAVVREEQKSILAAGIEGENSTAQLLKTLPGSYTVFLDVVVKYDGKVSEIDNIVIGNSGIFIIETKNHNGLITGDFADREWLQSKVGRGGTQYSNSFYSPVKQVGTHIFRLKNHLKKNNIRAHINGIVYFSNPQAQVRITGEQADVPVFAASGRAGKDMINYILNANDNIPDSAVRKIIEVLK